MEQRLSLITLGVTDLPRARRFYEEGLGWRASPASNEDVVFFQLGGIALSLFSRTALAADAQTSDAGVRGFGGIALAHNVRSQAEVVAVLEVAVKAGGHLLKAAEETSWGGFAGYFADPEGHTWEVAHNPFFPLDASGALELPRS